MPSLISDASTGTAVTVVPDGNGIILRFFDTDGLHQGSIRFTTGTGDRVQAEVLPRTRALHISLPKIKMAQARLRSRAVTNWVGAASESLDENSFFSSVQRDILRAVAEGLIEAGTTAFTLAGIIALLGGTITGVSALAIAAPLVAGIVLGLLFSSGVKDLESRQDSGGNLSVDFAEEPTPQANALPLDYKAPDSFLVPEKVDVTFEHPTPVPTPTPSPTPTPTPTPTPNPGGPPSNPTAGQEWTNPKDGSVLIWVPSGTFQMGSNSGNSGYSNGKPVHSVTLSGFWMGKYEVTVGQYRAYCTATGRSMPTSTPSWGWIDSHPMVNVSWHDAVAYGT
jgi:formylglycine-generating enzyme required for sulfatase activity